MPRPVKNVRRIVLAYEDEVPAKSVLAYEDEVNVDQYGQPVLRVCGNTCDCMSEFRGPHKGAPGPATQAEMDAALKLQAWRRGVLARRHLVELAPVDCGRRIGLYIYERYDEEQHLKPERPKLHVVRRQLESLGINCSGWHVFSGWRHRDPRKETMLRQGRRDELSAGGEGSRMLRRRILLGNIILDAEPEDWVLHKVLLKQVIGYSVEVVRAWTNRRKPATRKHRVKDSQSVKSDSKDDTPFSTMFPDLGLDLSDFPALDFDTPNEKTLKTLSDLLFDSPVPMPPGMTAPPSLSPLGKPPPMMPPPMMPPAPPPGLAPPGIAFLERATSLWGPGMQPGVGALTGSKLPNIPETDFKMQETKPQKMPATKMYPEAKMLETKPEKKMCEEKPLEEKPRVPEKPRSALLHLMPK